MQQLKKVISLSQAAKISGYNQDYLGSLIRKGEIRGKKIGRNWFTTEEELKNYFFKQKIRHQEFAIKEFLSPRRTTRIFSFALVIFVGLIVLGVYLFGSNVVATEVEVQQTLTSEVEAVTITHD